jgi:methionine-rich copper-binding protein CopC
MHRLTRLGVAAAGAAAIATFMLALGPPAYAHNYLVESTPQEGSTLTELPSEFSVTTSETLLDLAGDGGGFAIRVTNTAGQYFGDGCFAIVNQTLSTGAALGEAGDYLMQWQLVSSDGHTVSGEIGFSWQPDSDQTMSEGLDAPPACGGGTLDDVAPAEEGSTDLAPAFDASTAVLIASAVSLVLITAVALFLIAARRNRRER